jgi:hypothetical protein
MIVDATLEKPIGQPDSCAKELRGDNLPEKWSFAPRKATLIFG